MSMPEGFVRGMLEMGMGTDLHGGDYSKAACRAVREALQRSSLNFVKALSLDIATLPIRVTIGVVHPEAVDVSAVLACFPMGQVEVTVVSGGLDIPGAVADDFAVVASAAIEVYVPRR